MPDIAGPPQAGNTATWLRRDWRETRDPLHHVSGGEAADRLPLVPEARLMPKRDPATGATKRGPAGAFAAWLAFVTLAGCADENPAAPPPEAIAAGREAFATECAICHTARDAFDLAFFGFADADIVRRAVKHVDESTANEIVAWVHSLDVTPVGRTTAPFQPGSEIVFDDTTFWRAVFDTGGWPDELTPAGLRAIDVRNVSVPLRMPLWSVEEATTDWLPDVPLDSMLLEHAGGALRNAIEAYHAAPSPVALGTAIERFREASERPDGPCFGQEGAEARARECFEARRWMSALAAVDALRRNPAPDSVAVDVLDLWWDTGKVAQSVFFHEGGQHPLEMVASWLYMAWSFRPTRFSNEGGYLEQFLQLSGRQRMAAFTALRRMVAAEDVHEALPAQRFGDAYIAAARCPQEIRAGVVRFAFEFLDDWLDENAPLDAESRAEATILVERMYDDVSKLPPGMIEAGQLAAIATLRDRLLSRI
jgi:mono/diheme cytochrome c family protein